MGPRADARNYEIDGQWPSGKAAPLADGEMPEAFLILRRLMEALMGKKGKREFVQVVRLLETFRIADVEAGIQSALERGTIHWQAGEC